MFSFSAPYSPIWTLILNLRTACHCISAILYRIISSILSSTHDSNLIIQKISLDHSQNYDKLLLHHYIISLDNCIRQEQGYCRIQWQGADSNFQLDTQATGAVTAAAAGGDNAGTPVTCAIAYVAIPDGSQDGITPLVSALSNIAFQTEWCGSVLGYTGQTLATSIVCKSLIINRNNLRPTLWITFSFLIFII